MSIYIYTYLIVCPLVFLSGFVDAIAGGGGLISLPAYFISGLPSHLALGTNKLSAMMGTSLTTYRYAKLGYINFKRASLAIIFAFVGSSIGAKIALLIPDQIFKIIMLFVLPATAFYLVRKRNFGQTQEKEQNELKVVILCALVAFVIGVYDGIYGPGTGTFLILGFCAFANCSIQNANGLTKAVNLTTNIAAVFIFLMNDAVLLQLGLIAGLFSILGNYLGATYFEKKGAIGTKKIMIGVLAIFIIKVGYDLISA